MITKLMQSLYLVLSKLSWGVLIVVLFASYFATWTLMAIFEGADAKIASGQVFWWYFVVTAATVGYGDFAPVTFGGRIVGTFIMIFGIGTFAAIVTKLVEGLQKLTQKRRKGLMQLNLKDHIVIMGYRGQDTAQLISEIRGDASCMQKIVLCSHSVTENPFPDDVEFVHGPLTSVEVLTRACIKDANKVIIYGKTDDNTLATAVAVCKRLNGNAKAHIVACVQSEDTSRLLHELNEDIECVTRSHVVPLLVQAIQCPGSTKVINVMTSNKDTDATQYRIHVPRKGKSAQFADFMVAFKRHYNAIPIALADSWNNNAVIDLNPRNDRLVQGGMSLFYLADNRLDEQTIDWNLLLT